MALLRKLVLFVGGLLLLNGSLVQAQTVWTNVYNNPIVGPDVPAYVVTDNVGYVYVVGNVAVPPIVAPTYSYQVNIIKYEPDGTRSETWPDTGYGAGVRRFEGYNGQSSLVRGFGVDGSGNVYVTALSVNIAAGPLALIGKYDSNGNLLWTVQTGADQNSLVGMRVDTAGNVYLLLNLQIWTHDASGAYVRKFDTNGALSTSWPNQGYGVGVRRFIGFGRTLEVGGDGSVTVAGSRVDPVAVTIPLNRMAMWKYTAAGQLAWSNTNAPTSNTYEQPFKLILDDTGNSFVAGSTAAAAGQSRDYLLLKYGANGQLSSTWPDDGNGVGVRLYDYPPGTNDIARAMDLDSEGNVLISGLSQRTNGVDMVTVKYDAAGNLFPGWTNQGAGPGVRTLATMTLNTNLVMGVDRVGNVIVSTVLPSLFGHMRTTEYSTNGTAKLLGIFAGNAGLDEPKGLALDQLGNVFITAATPGNNQADTNIVTLGFYRNGAPIANAGLDQTVGVDANCQGSVTLNGSGSTDPDGDALTYVWSGTFGSVTGVTAVVTMERGTHEATLTVTDKFKVSVSDTVTITVADQTPPVVTVPASYTVNAGADGMGLVPSVIADVVATDNCTAAGSLNKLQSPFSGTPVTVGSHEITVTVSDASGNITTRTVALTVVDVTAPVIAGLTDATAAANAQGQASVPDLATSATITDNVTAAGAIVVSQAPAAGTLLGAGAHVVSITATDAAGNSTVATVNFTVVDTTAPSISSLGNLTVSAGANGLGIVPNASGAVMVADNVTPTAALIISQSPAAGTAVGLGSHVITVTVTDAAGNSASTTVILSVVDTTAPVISSLTASPSLLSPASGKLLPVVLTAAVADNTDASPTTQIVSVTSNEAIVAPGPRVKNPDYEITGAMTLNLRAKSSTSAGRIYYVTVSSTDDAGNVAQSTVQIKVATTSGGGGGGKNK